MMKRVIFLRHGQALHNPRAEAARTAGCSFEEFLRLMKEDDAFDAALTATGRRQAQSAAKQVEAAVTSVRLVVVSPLSRAIDTALLTMPELTKNTPMIAHDDLRERSGWLLNAKRRPRSELALRYPSCDFTSNLPTEEDKLWTEELEPTDRCAERGYRLLHWLAARPEPEIAVVGHGGLFHFTLNEHPQVRASDARTAARFGNCELRTCIMTWQGEGSLRTFALQNAEPASSTAEC